MTKTKNSLFSQFFDSLATIDTRALGFMRIGFAILIVIDLFMRFNDFIAHYTDQGILPIVAAKSAISTVYPVAIVSPYLFNGSLLFQSTLFALTFIAALYLLVGYRTKITTIILWILIGSLHSRNIFILNSGDSLLRLVLFWAMFLPWHYRYSMDRVLDENQEQSPPSIANFASFAFLIQIALVYFFASQFKTGTEWTHDYTAIFHAFHIDQLTTPIATWLLQFPQLLKTCAMVIVPLQFFGSILLFAPLFNSFFRIIATTALIIFQIAIATTFQIGLFPWICIVALLGFYPASFWNTVLPKPKNLDEHVSIFYDFDCGFCKRGVFRIKKMLRLDNVKICPSNSSSMIQKDMDERQSWIVIDSDGKRFYQFDAFILLCQSSANYRFFVPILQFAPIRFCGNIFYRYVASNRKLFSKMLRPPKFTIDPNYTQTPPAIVFLLTPILMFVLYSNILNLPGSQYQLPKAIKTIGMYLGLDQQWKMFSPHPPLSNTWFVIPGTFDNGQEKDLLSQSTNISFDKPVNYQRIIKNHRWSKYLMNLEQEKNKHLFSHYSKYLCQTNPQLNQLAIYLMKERISFQEKPFSIEKTLWWEWSCSEK